MNLRRNFRLLFFTGILFLTGTILLVLTGCPNPSNSDSSDDPEAPTSLSYAVTNAKYTKNVTITNNTPTVDEPCNVWQISPALPNGLLFDEETGVISGSTNNVQIEAETYTVTAENDEGSITATITIAVYGYITLNTGQSAAFVIGKPDYLSNTAGVDGATASTINQITGNSTFVDFRLFVPDTGNHRILGFDSIPAGDGTSANFALGQPDLTTASAATTSAGLNTPHSVFSNGEKLFIVDRLNKRVVIHNSIPTTSGASADVAVGSNSLTVAGAGGISASELGNPYGGWATKNKLIVADQGHNRILIWNSIPTSHGEEADLVLGQADFTSSGFGTTAQTLNVPTDVWSDGERLFVVDSGNHRVLIWNTFPTVNGQAADVVIGQADMTSSVQATTQTSLDTPNFISSNGNQIFVSDSNNERIMIWDSVPTSNNASAAMVLGQSDFTSKTEGVTADKFTFTNGIYIFDEYLFVSDEARCTEFLD